MADIFKSNMFINVTETNTYSYKDTKNNVAKIIYNTPDTHHITLNGPVFTMN